MVDNNDPADNDPADNDPSDTPPPYTTLSPPPYTFSLPPSTPSDPPSTTTQPSYALRQFAWRHQMFFPLSSSSSAAIDKSTYTVRRTWGANFSRSKPDLLITRTAPATANIVAEACATIRYARSGPLPWVPRALIQYAHGDDEECTMALDRADERGWGVEIGGGVSLVFEDRVEGVEEVGVGGWGGKRQGEVCV